LVVSQLAHHFGPVEAGQFFDEIASRPDFCEDQAAEQRTELSSLIGVVCLTENPLERLMWSHYAESHKGFVAEFFCKGFCFKSPFSICLTPFGGGGAVKVRYQFEQPILKTDRSNMQEVCYTKHKSWEYEQEWRLIEELSKGSSHPRPDRKGFVLLSFKPTDLRRIILGVSVESKVKARLKQMLAGTQFNHVSKEQTYVDPKSRELKSRHSSW
jgi:hypothetical protein